MIITVKPDNKKDVIGKLTSHNFRVEVKDNFVYVGSPNSTQNFQVNLNAGGKYPYRTNISKETSARVAEELITVKRKEFNISEVEKKFIHGILAEYGVTELGMGKNHCIANAVSIPSNVDNAFLVPEIAALYNIPRAVITPGSRKRVAICVLQEYITTPDVPVDGWYGGYRPSDMTEYWKLLGYTPVESPIIRWIPVQGGINNPGYSFIVDSETTLSAQIVGGVAKGIYIDLYVAQNTEAGMLLALNSAINATETPTTIACSWGARESTWTAGGLAAINSAAAEAVRKGITIFTAAGNSGASAGASSGELGVDFPSSSPFVISCGGTTLSVPPGGIDAIRNGSIENESTVLADYPNPEKVWTRTGGGFSATFPPSLYQISVLEKQFPPGSQYGGLNRRAVPDVAGLADPVRGYIIILGGTFFALGGTSAVAPLYAAAWSLIGREQFAAPILYGEYEKSSFNDIKLGYSYRIKEYTPGKFYSIYAYNATNGFDVCTGLGSINFNNLNEASRVAKTLN